MLSIFYISKSFYFKLVAPNALLQYIGKVNYLLLVILRHQTLKFTQKLSIIVSESIKSKHTFQEVTIHGFLDRILSV